MNSDFPTSSNSSISESPVVEVFSISKSFKSLRAVDQLEFVINRGEFVALLGPNGAGKTTLMEMIEGIQKPDDGHIKLFGLEWKNKEHSIRKRIGIALQETRFLEKVTVDEILDLFGSFYGSSRLSNNEILEQINLTEKRKSYVNNLSGGQRQKLALGVSLINRPELLLLDEPTTGLDPGARREIWDILMSLKRNGITLIITTHYMEEAEYLCDRILFMHNGKIIAGGQKEELLRTSDVFDVIEYKASQDHPEIKAEEVSGMINYTWNPGAHSGRIMVKDMKKALPDFFKIMENNGVEIQGLECRSVNLDDLFLRLTGKRLRGENTTISQKG